MLSVDRQGAERVATALKARPPQWSAVIHLGAESQAKGLRLETAAANVLAMPDSHAWSADIPCDKTGTKYTNINVTEPCLLATTAPLGRLSLPTDQHGYRWPKNEVWSRDAGSFFCNEVYFRSLSVIRSGIEVAPGMATPSLLPVLFVHLPVWGVGDPHTSQLSEIIGSIVSDVVRAESHLGLQIVS